MITYEKITTAQCDVYIEKYEEIKIRGLNLYVIVSIHRCDGRVKVRFATWEQAKQIRNTYKKQSRFTLDEETKNT